MAKRVDPAKADPGDYSIPKRVAQIIDLCAKRLPVNSSCLPRAFACHLELRRLGYDCELKIGVAQAGSGSIKAHAWVELGNEIVIGELPSIQDYAAFPEIEGTQR